MARNNKSEQQELEQQTTDLVPTAPAAPPAVVSDLDAMLMENAGDGFGNATAADYMVPSLKVAQDLSPEVKKNKPEYIEGLDLGMIFNSVSGEILEAPLRVIPCYRDRVAVEWKPNRGGFVAEHPASFIVTSKAVRNEKGEWILPGGNGNFLVETTKYYVLYQSADGNWHPAIIQFKITGAKVARKWLTLASQQLITLPNGAVKERPLYGTIYNLGVAESSKGQNSWYVWTVELGERVADVNLLRSAKDFHDRVKAGEVKSAEEQDDADGGDDQANNEPDNDF